MATKTEIILTRDYIPFDHTLRGYCLLNFDRKNSISGYKHAITWHLMAKYLTTFKIIKDMKKCPSFSNKSTQTRQIKRATLSKATKALSNTTWIFKDNLT